MNTRLIKRRDLRACAAILAADKISGFDDVDAALDTLNGYFEAENFLGVLAETGAIIGFALGNISHRRFGNVFYLSAYCTHVDQRARGVGSAIQKALEAELRMHSVGSYYISADRIEPATEFFTRRDFRRTDPAGYYTKIISM